MKSLNEEYTELYLKYETEAANARVLQDLLNNSVTNAQSMIDTHMQNWIANEAPKVRADTLQKQKQVRTGYTSEHFAPFAIPDWQAEDYFRVGGSIDYLVTVGADAVRDKREAQVSKIVLLDIKTGEADLNTVQRRIRDAVVAGRVEFATYNMTTQELRTWPLKTTKTSNPDKI